MSSDLTFITNEKNQNLANRFRVLIKSTRFFDALVGYFYTSGFHALYTSLEDTEKIRILIGINTDKQTHERVVSAQHEIDFSHPEARETFGDMVAEELKTSDDSVQVEKGIQKFIEWLKSGKLEIKAYPSKNIHAKLYIMTFLEDDRDVGRVITGSSNFTQSGLIDNLEFNVELKNRADYQFAQDKFNQLWNDAVDLKDKYLETINERTWLNDSVTPYELYLKFLYEYFKEDLAQRQDVIMKYIPESYKELEYQKQAVINAKKILEEYGGVFISDVVGLGKTYIATLLASQLRDGRTLVLAPPVLLERSNPGSWPNAFSDFKEAADYESIGKLDLLIKQGVGKYKNIIIDEAHRFRSENNVTYTKLAQICRGKRVILVTATPFNNSPLDILSQIKLFQNTRKSTIPNVPDLERFFNELDRKLKKLDRKRDRDEYMAVAKANAREIRDKVLKHLMVRRTRKEIEAFFGDDLARQGMKFPEVASPKPLLYQLNDEEDEIFTDTIELVAQKFTYARYMPLTFYTGEVQQSDEQAQKNMGKFIKILFIKRLESSFYAFKQTIERTIISYEKFIAECEKGNVYVSKKHINKIFDLIELDDDKAIQELIDSEKAKRYDAKDFKPEFYDCLKNDLKILKVIQSLWKKITRDPKLEEFVHALKNKAVLKSNKLIVFTESKETAEYISARIQKELKEEVLLFTGSTSNTFRQIVVDNFDAKVRHQADDYRILVTTEVLSEGVNLHRSNVVINYDIPWNPTRLMQRVGRINRVDTTFDKIYTFNFFPTVQSNDQIKLKEAAEAKINAFISMLGADAKLLTDGEEIESHELFSRLVSKETLTGEENLDESDLTYLKVIRDIRDQKPDLFAKIKRLPQKCRTSRKSKANANQLLTYFRKGKLEKFFIADGQKTNELDFIAAAKTLQALPETKKMKLTDHFYQCLEENKQAFLYATMEEAVELKGKGGRDTVTKILKVLKAIKDLRQLTDEQESYLKTVIRRLEEGAIPRQTAKTVLQLLEKEIKKEINAVKLVSILQVNIAEELLEEHAVESSARTAGPREVVLSEYFIG